MVSLSHPAARGLLPGALLLLPLAAGVAGVAGVARAQEPLRVKTQPLEAVASYPRKSAPAAVVSLNNTRIAAQIKARLDEVAVRVGEVVESGSVLARLDCTDYQLASRRAAAAVEALDSRIRLAELRLTRTRELADNQTVSEELLDERTADLSVLRADHRNAAAAQEKARIDVSRCVIKSPFRAVVAARLRSVGEFADVGAALLEIVDIERLEVAAQVPTVDAARMAAAAELYFEDSASRYRVRLRTVAPLVDTQTRNQEVRLLFSGEPALPGAAGKLAWRDERPHAPARLLVRRGADLGIFIAAAGTARFHAVPGAQQGRAIPVELPLSTLLVTEGHYGLRDAQPIVAAE